MTKNVYHALRMCKSYYFPECNLAGTIKTSMLSKVSKTANKLTDN